MPVVKYGVIKNYKNNKFKNLSIREWTCPECGTNHDLNAYYKMPVKTSLKPANEVLWYHWDRTILRAWAT